MESVVVKTPDFIVNKICPYCSSKMNVKEHETYFGFFCSSCNKGGSFSKVVEKKKVIKNDPNVCGCGGKIVTKDHGTWIGWYCTKCKQGGSRNKTRRK